MRRGTLAAALVLAFVALVVMAWTLNERAAWARFEQIRMMGILNAAGTDTLLLQEGGTAGLPVAIVSGGGGGGALGVWKDSQNKVLAQCGVGETALDTDTSTKVIIKVGEDATDNVWCNVGGTVDVDNGFRPGTNSEGFGIEIADPADIECCGEGAATFKISVAVQ